MANAEHERRGRMRAYAAGLEFVGAVVGMALLGWLIDRWAGTLPWCTLAGLAVGLIGGSYNMLRASSAWTGTGSPPGGPRSRGQADR